MKRAKEEYDRALSLMQYHIQLLWQEFGVFSFKCFAEWFIAGVHCNLMTISALDLAVVNGRICFSLDMENSPGTAVNS